MSIDTSQKYRQCDHYAYYNEQKKRVCQYKPLPPSFLYPTLKILKWKNNIIICARSCYV